VVATRAAPVVASGRVVRLLLAEDDADIAEPMARALRRDGYDVDWVMSAAGLFERLHDVHVDLLILDLGLPDADGVELCRRIRRTDARLPIIMVTARTDELDVVIGFDAGADDYIGKPFSMSELRARVRSRLRLAPTDVLQVQDVRVDLAARRVTRADEEIVLSLKEYDLLVLLMRSAGIVVSRDRIMAEVWDDHWHGPTKTLDVHVSWLRRKLGDDGRYITTVRGVGLRFERG
jgi:DNA-binding response OmpR family regulator